MRISHFFNKFILKLIDVEYNHYMRYEIHQNEIRVYSLDEFNPKHIFECGQVFCYKKIDDKVYAFYPDNKVFLIYPKDNFYVIRKIGGTGNIKEVIELFDLDNNYDSVKKRIEELVKNRDFEFNKQVLLESMKFGYGIRILKQNVFETIVSFLVSQNNNIKRIISSLDKIRENLGKKIELDLSGVDKYRSFLEKQKFYTFPKKEFFKQKEEFFISMGLGYRAKYLVKTLEEVQLLNLNEIMEAKTEDLRDILTQLSGVGRKVADCILLFGFSKKDVFPVDTWIRQGYNEISKEKEVNTVKISNVLEFKFGELSGYVQQYLFYFKREKVLVNTDKF